MRALYSKDLPTTIIAYMSGRERVSESERERETDRDRERDTETQRE